jgi:hypothetical protein
LPAAWDHRFAQARVFDVEMNPSLTTPERSGVATTVSLNFSRGGFRSGEVGAGQLVGLVVPDGDDKAAGVARRAGVPGPVGVPRVGRADGV